tara:strand:- start:517 stop:732 length:216 start_codon:yes stop_codon:yes gene_type:complete
MSLLFVKHHAPEFTRSDVGWKAFCGGHKMCGGGERPPVRKSTVQHGRFKLNQTEHDVQICCSIEHDVVPSG